MQPRDIPLTFEKGINDRYAPTMLGPGEAVTIQNWSPEPNGMLRPRQSWVNEPVAGLPAVRLGRGIHHHAFDTIQDYVVAAGDVIGDQTQRISWTGGSGNEEVQQFTISGVSGGTFTITWDNGGGPQTTGAITYVNGDQVTTTANILAALEAVWGTEFAVTYYYWTGGIGFSIYFNPVAYGKYSVGTYARSDVALMTADGAGLVPPKSLTFTVAVPHTDDGSITISIAGYGTTGSISVWDSSQAAWPDACPTTADIDAALTALDADLGDCTITRNTTIPDKVSFDITFDGALAGQHLPLAVLQETGGGSGFTLFDTTEIAGAVTIYALDSLASTTWASLGEISSPAGQAAIIPMASGASKLGICSPGNGLYKWNGSSFAAASDPGATETLLYREARFFTSVGTTLWYSRLLSIDAWTDPVTSDDQSIPVGDSDGETIVALADFDNSVFIGKQNSVWALSGSSATDFTLRRLVGGGCAPGNTLIPTPYGLVAIGETAVWLYTGGPLEEISKNIRGSYGMTGNLLTGAFCDGKLFVCDQGSGTIWVNDMETGAWSTEPPGDSDEGPVMVYAKADYLYSQPRNATTNSLVMYRQMPLGERSTDENMAETFHLETAHTWFGTSERPYTIRGLNLRLRQEYGDSGDTSLIITPTIHHGEVSEEKAPMEIQPKDDPPVVWRERMSLGGTGWGASFDFLQELAVGEEGAISIEEAILEVDIEEKR